MPPPKKTPPSPGSVNVYAMRPAPVKPLSDWRLEGEFGHMAFEAGNTGRLVRLADVLRWLQSSRSLPRTDALKLLCDGLNVEAMGWLYWLQATTWAVPVSPVYTFGYATAEQIAVRKETDGRQQRQAWLERERQNNRFCTPMTAISGRISTSYPEPTEPGLPALLKYLQGWWTLSTRRGGTCDVLDDLKIRYATTLAIRLDKAHALWDYGRTAVPVKDFDMTMIAPPDKLPTTWAELVDFRKRHPLATWCVTQKALVEPEKLRREAVLGATGVAKVMAGELGISVTLLNNKIRQAKEPGKRERRQIEAA